MVLPIKVADFISFANFEWHGQNEVGNIAILVLWRDREKLYLPSSPCEVCWKMKETSL